MIQVILNIPDSDNKTIQVTKGENLLNVIRNAGVNIDAPCNGNGTCGKCKVRLLKGKVKESSNHNISKEAKSRGLLLACASTVIEPVEIGILKESILNINKINVVDNDANQINDKYYKINDTFSKLHLSEKYLKKIDLTLDLPTIDDNISDVTRLRKFIIRELKCKNIEINLNILKRIPFTLRDNNFNITVIYCIIADDSIRIIDVCSKETNKLYGIAIDVGTTSVAACLVDLDNLNVLGEVSCANAQSKYGADVINRIIYSTKANGLQLLKDAIVKESIDPLILELCKLNKISSEDILLISISANTTMSHLLLGVYPDYLRKEPFIPVFTDIKGLEVTVDDIGLSINRNALINISPSVASYVGGDISAGVMASMMRESEKNTILIDLGTNGELVYGNDSFLITCACSAGPAFEGGEISCGMRAANGAIESIYIDKNTYKPEIEIINGIQPLGICGSGIIDLISELKRVSLIDAKGKFIKEVICDRVKFDSYGLGCYIIASKDEYDIEEDIYITEIDIDNFIRAKAAVYSATYVLLSSLGLDFDQVDEIKVAGGIGNHINIKSAINIGLFPDIEIEKYQFIGNSSLTGSYMSLINKNAKYYMDDIANNMTYLELSVYPGYMDEFISASFIPHTNISRFPTHT
ncbi:MAG: corrinoid activation/regeneration protein AcsV [Eubacteriaceae bacterium]